MVTIYFSGTGNTKYIAEEFSKRMKINVYSVEESVDFKKIIKDEDTICICYPIYGSTLPRIMEEFALKYKEALKNKKIIVFSTQLMYSGDGARILKDILKENKYIYARHFNMPNNICNFSLFKVRNNGEKYIKKANKRLDKICKDISNNKVHLQGFNLFSIALGLIQRVPFNMVKDKLKGAVYIDNNKCVKCNRCVKACPMKNLEIKDDKLIHKNNCTLCYRCINMCDQKAINIIFESKIRKQYKGPLGNLYEYIKK